MLTIYSDKHRSQDARFELTDGELVPPYEKPARADAILTALRATGIAREIRAPQPLADAWLTRVHRADYVAFLRGAWHDWQAAHGDRDALPLCWPARAMRHTVPEGIDGKLGYYSFDAGTPITAGTWQAITTAADVALTGAQGIAAGEPAAFALCRPPGHHAGSDCYGGYCFFNNAALAATLLRANGFDRVAVLDIDYHHGNGTQAIFYDRPDVLFVSVHADPREEFPFFLGYASETGSGAGEGFTLNLPLPLGTGWDSGYAAALDRACERIVDYDPGAVVVSLGVDTHEDDPISRFRLQTAQFPSVGRRLGELGRPTLFVMEGGYGLDALGSNVAGVLAGFERVRRR
jgi:acetoin utilization deacetylase AcuC-like enzyme